MFELDLPPASVHPDPYRPDVVLLVDDQPMIGEAIRRMLVDQSGLEFHYCADAASAVETAERVKPTVILQDLVMPGIDGLVLVDRYRANPVTSNISIIVLSSKEDPAVKSDAFKGGANDYLVKLPDKIELVARIRLHSRAYLNQIQRDEAYRSLTESQQQLVAANAALADRVNELQAMRDELARLVSTDPLTGITSRRRWMTLATSEFTRHRRYHHSLSMIMADLDFFKQVNDTHGHDIGDQVLRQFADTLRAACRQSDVPARMGGEEFAVLLPETTIEGGVHVARRIVEMFRCLEMSTPSGVLKCSCSVGIAQSDDGDQDVDDVLRRADRALYDAKRSGRDTWRTSAIAVQNRH
jgi:two-component system, chemotaxis family, response regulator WspR